MRFAQFTADEGVAQQAAWLSTRCLRAETQRTRSSFERYLQRLDRVSADEASELPLDELRPRPALLGVGVAATDAGDRPLVVADAARLEEQLPLGETVPLADAAEVRHLVLELTGGARLGGTVVLAVEEPQPHFGCGGEVRSGARRGTLGALVRSAGGRDAILTAGHVAARGAPVRDASGNSGATTFSCDPSSLIGTAPAADVAVIETRSWDPPRLAVSGPAIAQGRQRIELHDRQGTVVAAGVQAFCTYFNWPGGAGAWADLYLTDLGVTSPGDSGGPAFLAGSDRIVGHIVGASGSTTSYVQAIDTQLRAAGATLR